MADTLTHEAFDRLLQVVHELREKCPWDREQTNESLRHLTIEETFELSEALLQDDPDEIRKELGDILLHVLFYSRIAEEQQRFSTREVMTSLTEKLIRRHPHIYGEVLVENASDVAKNWEQIKQQEKDRKKVGALSGVPAGLPALIKALRIQEKARNVGFDWEEPHQVWDKVEEEIQEFRSEAAKIEAGEDNLARAEKEFGDVFFALVNYARFVGINPEDALEKTNRKFISRFNYMESKVLDSGRSLKEMRLEEMDVYWNESKQHFP